MRLQRILTIVARRRIIRLGHPSRISRFCSSAQEPSSITLGSVFERYEFPDCEFRYLLKRNDFLLDSSPVDIDKSFKLLLSWIPSSDFLVSLVRTAPGILKLEFLEKFRHLGIEDITPKATGNLLVVASKFDLSAEDITQRVKYFSTLGFTDETVSKILESVPAAVIFTDDEVQSKIDFLLEIGIQRDEIDSIFGFFPWIVEFGVSHRIKPLIDEFKDLGFCVNEITREIVKTPWILGMENGEFSQCVELLRKVKCRAPNINGLGEFRSGCRVKERVDFLRKNGLTTLDAFKVLFEEPRVIFYSMKDIEKKVNFLTDKMKFDINRLVEVPEYLGVDFEKMIVARFNVIDYLRSIGGLGKDVDLRTFVKLNGLRFYNLFVKPYPECKIIYGEYIPSTDCI